MIFKPLLGVFIFFSLLFSFPFFVVSHSFISHEDLNRTLLLGVTIVSLWKNLATKISLSPRNYRWGATYRQRLCCLATIKFLIHCSLVLLKRAVLLFSYFAGHLSHQHIPRSCWRTRGMPSLLLWCSRYPELTELLKWKIFSSFLQSSIASLAIWDLACSQIVIPLWSNAWVKHISCINWDN